MASPSPAAASRFYQAAMTPIIFVSFLVSLAWVELRYSMLRGHAHDVGRPGQAGSNSNSNDNDNHSSDGAACSEHKYMPAWLHGLLYRRRPFRYVLIRGRRADAGRDDDGYYHSMQRKLLRMESAEAFRIRTTVLWVMGAVVAVGAWAVVMAARWVAGSLW